jgi:hypothetical protein
MGLTELNLPHESYIRPDQFGLVGLIWLVLNGPRSDDDGSLVRVMVERGSRALAERNIGLKIFDDQHPPDSPAFLNPDADVFICLDAEHFVAAKKADTRGKKLLVFDCEAGQHPQLWDITAK